MEASAAFHLGDPPGHLLSAGRLDQHSGQDALPGILQGRRRWWVRESHCSLNSADCTRPAETLFNPSSTAQRKFWGFEIFSKVLPLLPKDDVPLIFSQNFMKCWMNHLSGEDRYLHKAALKLVRGLTIHYFCRSCLL